MSASRDRKPFRTRRGSKLTRLLVVLGVVTGAALLAGNAVGHDHVAAPGAARAAASTDASASTEGDRGRQVYLRDCAWCHGDQGEGSSVAPDLSDTSKGDIDFMLRTGRMPLSKPGVPATEGPPAYDDATIRALVDYVGGFGTGEPVPVVRAGDRAQGQSLFISHCAACHSASGTGVILTNGIRTPQLYDTPPTQIAEAIRMGPGAMPPFSATTMDDQDVDDLVSYVSRLGPQQVKGGASLDQYGPILEGMLLWLLPIPVLIVVILLLGRRAR